MKKVNKILVLILIGICCIFTFNFIDVKADSGWDTDYDSGWSGGWDSGYNSGNSYGSGSSCDVECVPSSTQEDYVICGCIHDEDNNFLDVIIFIIFVIIFVYSAILKNLFTTEDTIDDAEILSVIPDFNKEEFLKQCYDNFIKLQNSWSDFDYDSMKQLISDEMYNNYVSQLKVLSTKKQKNVMSDFVKHNIYISNFVHDNEIDTIEVILDISFFDYVINNKEEVVRGNKTRKVNNKYILTYCRKVKNVDSNICPNCGAELENTHTTKCSYCRTTITNNTHNWVLTKKEIKR